MRIPLLTLLSFAALSTTAQSLNLVWEDEVTVTHDPSVGRVRPRIALSTDNTPVVVWGHPPTGNVYAATLVADTFAAPVWINATGPDAYVRNWTGPSITAVGDTVMVTYDQMDAAIEGAVWFQRSTDRGATFSEEVRVDVATGNGMTRLGTLAARNGRELLCGYILADSNDANAQGHLARSTDGGTTWLPSLHATAASPGLTCDCCPPGLAVQGSRAAFLFRNNDSNLRDIRTAVSEDYGISIAATHDLDARDWDISSCPSTGPDAHLSGDSLVHVWMSGDLSPARVYVGTTHTSTGMGSVVALDDTASGAQNFPRIAGSGDTLMVVWRQMVAGYSDVQMRWSTSGMAGLRAPQRVNADSPGTQDLPDVAFANGEVHVVWQDDEHARIAYRKGRLVPAVAIDNATASMTLEAFPNPASDQITIRTSVAGKATLHSLSGQLLMEQHIPTGTTTLDVQRLPKGMYLLGFSDGTHTSQPQLIVLL